jgi:RNA polymerase sigma factor (sigma-70 family)
MPSGQLGQVWRRLRGLVGKRPVDERGDGQLLEQFIARRDMAAFEALVRRYGPLVLGVCRRVLGDAHDADDAFQATFLVLARRASSIQSQGAVGSWLCGTAYRISLKARAAKARRMDQERKAGTMLKTAVAAEAAWQELKPVLDEELNRLPAKYRVPLVLCYLEGKTNEAAAKELGWAPGSMSYRLAQARERLRERLVRRGIAVSSVILGPALAAHALAEVPAKLLDPTVQGGWLFAAGRAADMLSTQAVVLAEMMLQSIAFLKAMLIALVGLFLLVLVGGVGWLALRPGHGHGPVVQDTRPGKREPDRIAVLFSPENQRFGLTSLLQHDPQNPLKPKRLTRDERGNSNNVRVVIDGHDYLFGQEAGGGQWVRENGKLWKEVRLSERRWRSIMEFVDEKVRVSQTVEIVKGEQTQAYDTALVKYEVENLDRKAHTVGIRAMIDTYIGANDGVPFLVPPTDKKPAYLMETLEVFDGTRVPEFIRALESSNLSDKNATVAEMGLKLRGCEPLDRVVICRWPEGGEARWEWAYQAMNDPPDKEKDSCVALYWGRKLMRGGDLRTLGYTYGLGRTADGTSRDPVPMRLLVGGAATVGKTFTLTAYIKGARAGQKVKIELPEDIRLAPGQADEQVFVADPDGEYSQVSWRVQAKKVGTLVVSAEWAGRRVTQDVHIRESSIFD